MSKSKSEREPYLGMHLNKFFYYIRDETMINPMNDYDIVILMKLGFN